MQGSDFDCFLTGDLSVEADKTRRGPEGVVKKKSKFHQSRKGGHWETAKHSGLRKKGVLVEKCSQP